MSHSAPPPDLVRHLHRAAEWRLLSQILSYPGDDWPHRIKLLLGCIRDPGLAELARTALKESSPGLWLSLFGPAGPVRARRRLGWWAAARLSAGPAVGVL